ncbi:MAG: leucine-rich repeat protein [Eubacteriales bacterium]|nr:leucine-rich repeat protein [Eubacteriales bacterium]
MKKSRFWQFLCLCMAAVFLAMAHPKSAVASGVGLTAAKSSDSTLSYTTSETWFDTVPGGSYIMKIIDASSSIPDASITYQWYERKEYGLDYTPISGATGPEYTIPPITADNVMVGYKCEISDGSSTREVWFHPFLETGLDDVERFVTIYAPLGTTMTLDPGAKSSSEVPITYKWYGPNYNLLDQGTSGTYSFVMSATTDGKYECAMNDGYKFTSVTFTVIIPEPVGELPLGTEFAPEGEDQVLYSFTPSKSGFYQKKSDFYDATPVYDDTFRQVDTFDRAEIYLRAGKTYYIPLKTSTNYIFELSQEKDLPNTIVKAGICRNISWTLDQSGVVTYDGNLTSLEDGDEAGNRHLYPSEVKEIIFSNGITSVGSGYIYSPNEYFSNYDKLEKVTFSGPIISIGRNIFKGCKSLREVVFEDTSKLEDIAAGAFEETPYINSQTGDFVMVGTIVVGYRGTTPEATIPAKATVLGSQTMRGSNNLEQLTILDKLKRINDFSIAECRKLPSVNVPGNVTDIEYCAFYSDTALENVVLGDGVERIGTEAFFGCTSLKEITIPKSVNYIGDYAIGYARAGYTADTYGMKHFLNDAPPTVKCYYKSEGYKYAKNHNLPIELLDEKDLAAGYPLVFVSCSTSNGTLKEVIVTYAGENLIENKDYTITIDSDKRSFVITGIGEYHGNYNGTYGTPSTGEESNTDDTGEKPDTSVTDDTGEKPDTSNTDDTGEKPGTDGTGEKPNTDNTGKKPDTSGTDSPNASSSSSIQAGQKVNHTVSRASYKIGGSKDEGFTATYLKPMKRNLKTVIIPATIDVEGITCKVIAVANNALKGQKKLTKVTIGTNVKTIGKNAFKGCKKLKTITVKSKSMKKIGAKAFFGIHKKAVIKVPKQKRKAYKKLFSKKTGIKAMQIK